MGQRLHTVRRHQFASDGHRSPFSYNSMFDWLHLRRLIAKPPRPRIAMDVDPEPSSGAGEYQQLYRYLRDRYANRLVLTFAEIESLLGFSLPDLARVQLAWWGGVVPGGSQSIQSIAWTLAGRTATANLPAQCVVFERS